MKKDLRSICLAEFPLREPFETTIVGATLLVATVGFFMIGTQFSLLGWAGAAGSGSGVAYAPRSRTRRFIAMLILVLPALPVVHHVAGHHFSVRQWYFLMQYLAIAFLFLCAASAAKLLLLGAFKSKGVAPQAD